MREVMTPHGMSIGADELAAEAMRMLEQKKITALLVTGSDDELLGILHIHDLLRAGVV